MRMMTWLALVLLPTFVGAQTPESILESVREKQLERWEGLQSYAVTSSISGMETTTVYKRSEVQTDDGPRTSFVPVTASMQSTGGKGFPSGPFGDDASATLDEARAMEDFIENAELVGRETVDGREAFHLRVADASQLDSPGADDFTLDVADVWVDASEYVMLKMSMAGTMLEDGQSRPVTIERIQTDYREVPGSNLYESFHQVMTMSGAMTEADREDLLMAKQELDKMKQELANMPAQQRAMVEQMMGPRLEMMEQMIQESGITMDIVVSKIEVNPL